MFLNNATLKKASNLWNNQAWGFVRKNLQKTGVGGFVEVVSKNGKSIEKYSDAVFESEFLHKSNSSFKIKEIKFIDKEIINIDDVVLSQSEPDIITNFYRIIIEEL